MKMAAARISPAAPMVTNMERQPKLSIRKVSSGSAMAVPSEEAQFQMPVAVPRWRMLNQSRDTRAQVGKCGASPTPSTMRAPTNVQNDVTMPPSICPNDQQVRPSVSISRGPSRSASAPAGSCAKA